MNNKDKGLDDLFKKKLEDPVDQIGYKEEDWTALEKMLDQQKKRKGIIFWLPYIASVAALLLLFLGWWNFRPQVNRDNHHNKFQASNQPVKSNTGTNGGAIRQPVNPKQTQTPANAVNYAANTGVSAGRRNGKTGKSLSAAGSRRDTTGLQKNDLLNTPQMEALTATSHSQVTGPSSVGALPVSSIDIPQPAIRTTAIKTDMHLNKPKEAYRPQYAISVLAAPDINGVGSFQQGKVGTNFGLLFSAGLFKKISLSTGVLYSVKPYTESFQDYHTKYQFPVTPVNVTADCRMLDIPLNLGYELYNKHQSKITVGTGLSSYIMLHESYKFNYTDSYSYTTGPANYNVPGVNKYFFGVLNLNATYQRQLNSNVGISLQPYLKLPLTNLGYSQVRLQTTGVAIGVTWNFNSLAKH